MSYSRLIIVALFYYILNLFGVIGLYGAPWYKSGFEKSDCREIDVYHESKWLDEIETNIFLFNLSYSVFIELFLYLPFFYSENLLLTKLYNVKIYNNTINVWNDIIIMIYYSGFTSTKHFFVRV